MTCTELVNAERAEQYCNDENGLKANHVWSDDDFFGSRKKWLKQRVAHTLPNANKDKKKRKEKAIQ